MARSGLGNWLSTSPYPPPCRSTPRPKSTRLSRCVRNPLHTHRHTDIQTYLIYRPRLRQRVDSTGPGTNAIDWLTCLVHLESGLDYLSLNPVRGLSVLNPLSPFASLAPRHRSTHSPSPRSLLFPLSRPITPYHSNCGIKSLLSSRAHTPRRAESRAF